MVRSSSVRRSALAAALLAPAPALAQMNTGELHERAAADPARQSRLAGQLDFHTQNPSGRAGITVLDPSIYGSFSVAALSPTMDLSVDFAWRMFTLVVDRSFFRAGNPYVGVRLGIWGDHWRARVGGGVALPIMNAYEFRDLGSAIDFLSADLLALGVWGAWDGWLLARGYLPFVLRGDVEYRAGIGFVGGELGLGVLPPVTSEVRDTAVFFQLAAFGGVRPVPGLALGGRLQLAYFSRFNVNQADAQVALVPFVRGEFGNAFVEGRLMMNLDEPLGFAFDRGRVWALTVAGGADL